MKWIPHFLASHSSKSMQAKAELEERYGCFSQDEANVLVPAGGDGLVLQALMLGLNLNKPVYPMHRGNKGEKANDYQVDSLMERLDATEKTILHPLRVVGVYEVEKNGKVLKEKCDFHAMNDVYIKIQDTLQDRRHAVSENVALEISAVAHLDISASNGLRTCIEGDGVVFATPFGNSAYTHSAGGIHINSKAPLLTATAICPSKGYLKNTLSDDVIIRVKGLNRAYRPIRLVADHAPQIAKNLIGCKISLDKNVGVVALYDVAYMEKLRETERAQQTRRVLTFCNRYLDTQLPWHKSRAWGR